MGGNCLNCREPLIGDYCHACGQRADAGRLNFRRLRQDILERVLLYDTVIAHTLWGLVRRPETVIGRYLAGERVKFVNPVKLFVAAMLAEAIFDPLYDWRLRELFGGPPAITELYDWRVVQLLFVLAMAAFRLGLYHRSGLRFVEHAVFCLFMMSEAIFAHLLIGLPLLIGGLPWLSYGLAIQAEEATERFFIFGFFALSEWRFGGGTHVAAALRTLIMLGAAFATIEMGYVALRLLRYYAF